MRKFCLALAGLATLGLGAISAEPAKAQHFSITIGSGFGGYGHGYHRGYGHGYHRGYWPAYHRPYYRPIYRRPVYYAPPVYYGRPVYYAPRCVTRIVDRWNGWRWVQTRRRTCR